MELCIETFRMDLIIHRPEEYKLDCSHTFVLSRPTVEGIYGNTGIWDMKEVKFQEKSYSLYHNWLFIKT